MTTRNENSKPSLWKSPRVRWLTLILGGFLILGAAYGVYWNRDLRYSVYTDDAYVNGNVVQITPRISGTVVAIGADNTQFVKAGQTLVRLDPDDAKVTLQESEAQLAKTVRQVRNLFATTSELQANVQVRRTDLAKAQNDYARRARLERSGAISQEELQHADDAVRAAQAALMAAEQQTAANRALIDGTTIESNPAVRDAAAAVHSAYLNYARTVLPAPVSGFVARRDVQLGERVNSGTPLMAVVPLDQVWVDANFKESQLDSMRVGQPVSLISDLYGSNVAFHGRVIGFGAGTGSAFSLLPAQNATGNWIKIVQRVPVRVALDPRELARHPLQIGLSMKAYVNVRDDSGQRLPEVATNDRDYSTDVFQSVGAQADAAVRRIIAANEPAAGRSGAPHRVAAHLGAAGAVPLALHGGRAPGPDVVSGRSSLRDSPIALRD
ncbi:MAG TPA: HlyD family efflux transporter periplasmic adaptor subunit [Steroidobacteraceae bacterium]|jgi:membrane fusion protein (multidrug efflux system)|nr:HlyD family efflux transporter periplasmic adaptor subunit [Steroidobacteraceae bacterium]